MTGLFCYDISDKLKDYYKTIGENLKFNLAEDGHGDRHFHCHCRQVKGLPCFVDLFLVMLLSLGIRSVWWPSRCTIKKDLRP